MIFHSKYQMVNTSGESSKLIVTGQLIARLIFLKHFKKVTEPAYLDSQVMIQKKLEIREFI